MVFHTEVIHGGWLNNNKAVCSNSCSSGTQASDLKRRKIDGKLQVVYDNKVIASSGEFAECDLHAELPNNLSLSGRTC